MFAGVSLQILDEYVQAHADSEGRTGNWKLKFQ